MKMVRNFLIVALVGLMAFGAFHGPFDSSALAMDVTNGAGEGAATITVEGSGTVYHQPEQAEVRLGVQENAESVVDAQGTVNEKIDAVTNALIENGINREDISVGYLGIYSNYDYNTSPATIVGYTAWHQLDIKVKDIARAGEIVDIALKAGANQLDGISFSLISTTGAHRQAMELAIEDAAAKAENVAAAYGKKLGRLISMTEVGSYSAYDNGLSARATEADATGAPTEIVAGDLSISSTINATYELMD